MKLASIVFLARHIAGNAAASATVQRIKEQIGTRRAMMDVALRRKRFKRGE
jgi:hypothetical protein